MASVSQTPTPTHGRRAPRSATQLEPPGLESAVERIFGRRWDPASRRRGGVIGHLILEVFPTRLGSGSPSPSACVFPVCVCAIFGGQGRGYIHTNGVITSPNDKHRQTRLFSPNDHS